MQASQFNCLEMTGPAVAPVEGIAIYANDPTQGPKCALACPAGTVFRNYLCQDGKGQHETQIDCLADVAAVVDNEKHQFWFMFNGYALPTSSSAMSKLSKLFNAQEGLEDAAKAALRIGVHWDTSVVPPHEHRVAQVYVSALPVAYASGTKPEHFEPFARLVLRGAYEATLAVGQLKAAKLGSRATVFLTALGGGAFGNRIEWIKESLIGALDKFRDAPLDVKLVHYGTSVPAVWARDVDEEGLKLVQCPICGCELLHMLVFHHLSMCPGKPAEGGSLEIPGETPDWRARKRKAVATSHVDSSEDLDEEGSKLVQCPICGCQLLHMLMFHHLSLCPGKPDAD